MATTHPALELLAKLLAIPAPPGREHAIGAFILEHVTGLGYPVRQDPSGNILVELPGTQPDAPRCCIAAHMDEIGMVVTVVRDDGDLLVAPSGGLHPWKLGEGPVQIMGDHAAVVGILSMGSTHTSGAADRPMTWDNVRVITGLSAAELQRAGVRPGSSAVPTPDRRGPLLFGPAADPLVAAWTFDDRLGVVSLLRLLESLRRRNLQPVHPTLLAFTVHEEGGGHGAKVVAQRAQPEIFVAVDGCPMPPGSPLRLDGRPGIWSKDRITVYDHGLTLTLLEAARRAGTALQPVVYDAAASDASLVYAAGAAQRVACFGHVRENSHGFEIIRHSVIDNLHNSLVEFVTNPIGPH